MLVVVVVLRPRQAVKQLRDLHDLQWGNNYKCRPSFDAEDGQQQAASPEPSTDPQLAGLSFPPDVPAAVQEAVRR